MDPPVAPVTTVPVTVPREAPFTVTVLTPPLLVTVTTTEAGEEDVVPKTKTEVALTVAVAPSCTVLPVVLTSKEQGFTVIVAGATILGMVEPVTLKIHEP